MEDLVFYSGNTKIRIVSPPPMTKEEREKKWQEIGQFIADLMN